MSSSLRFIYYKISLFVLEKMNSKESHNSFNTLLTFINFATVVPKMTKKPEIDRSQTRR